MKPDFDLIRKILLKLEEEDHYPEDTYGKSEIRECFPDYEKKVIHFNLDLITEAGLIQLKPAPNYRYVYGLTLEGCNFIELAKEDTIWNKAKNAMLKTGIMSLEVMLKVLIETGYKAASGQL